MSDQPTEKLIKEPIYDLSKHPEHARLVGEIAASWTVVEHQLCALFTVLSNSIPQRSQAAFYALVNNGARIDMLRAISKDKLLGDKTRADLDVLLERARDASGKRNTYVHKLWLVIKGNAYLSEQTGQEFPFGQKRPVTIRELEGALLFIKETAEAVSKFTRDYSIANPLQIPVRDLHSSLRKQLPEQHPHRRPPTDRRQ